MRNNICRPISFFNNFVPASIENHGWEYYAFGVFDGVEVGPPIISADPKGILEQIWEHKRKIFCRLQGKYSVQTIYAVCYEDDKEERKFWENDIQAYVFFCRLQFKGDLQSLREHRRELKSMLNSLKGISAMIYFTYDNSDLMIVIKADSYLKGAGIINDFHQRFNFSFSSSGICVLKNSFSVLALKQEYINRVGIKDFRAKLNLEKIDSVSIQIIERECGNISQIVQKMEQSVIKSGGRVVRMPVLGTHDEIITVYDIGWGDFLSWYCVGKGIFHNTSQLYHKNIAGTTTTICTELPQVLDGKFFLENSIKKYKDKNIVFFDNYVKDMQRYLEEQLNSGAEENKKYLYKEMYVILNTLQKFSGEIFTDYAFFAILRPIHTLLDLMKSERRDFYYEFIKNFNMYIQNSVKFDRNVMQVMDFNARIYDIPSKLSAFYTAFIYKISRILNVPEQRSRHLYDFIVVPGMVDVINVCELYPNVSDSMRLFRVEMPENKYYNVETIMIIFAHEVAHYVGTGLRQRMRRMEYIIESIAEIYVNYIRSYWSKEIADVYVEESKWIDAKGRMKELLQVMLEREKDENFLREQEIGHRPKKIKETLARRIAENNIKNEGYFIFLERNIYGAFMDIRQYLLPDVFAQTLYSLSEEKQREVCGKIGEMTECFLVRYSVRSTRMTLDNVMEQLKSLYEEGFADLMSISILGLNACTYLNSIIKECEEQGMSVDDLCTSNSIFRIMAVLAVMYKDCAKKWKEDVYYNDEYVEKRKVVMVAIRNIKLRMAKGSEYLSHYTSNCVYALFNKAVYKNVHAYLLMCWKTYDQKVRKSRTQKKHLEDLEGFLNKYRSTNNAEDRIVLMEQFIEDFRKRTLSQYKKQ